MSCNRWFYIFDEFLKHVEIYNLIRILVFNVSPLYIIFNDKVLDF